jgi:hypothetical protein
MHIPYPEKLSDREWADKLQQLAWVQEMEREASG